MMQFFALPKLRAVGLPQLAAAAVFCSRAGERQASQRQSADPQELAAVEKVGTRGKVPEIEHDDHPFGGQAVAGVQIGGRSGRIYFGKFIRSLAGKQAGL